MRALVFIMVAAFGCGGTPKPDRSATPSQTAAVPEPAGPIAAGPAGPIAAGPAEPIAAAPTEPVAAAPNDEVVCTEQEVVNCFWLALRHDMGMDGYTKDRTLAASYYDIACRSDDLDACTSLAELYRWGRGVSPDSTRARALFRKACDGGAECVSLAFFLLDSADDDASNDAADRREALELFERACDAGDEISCHVRGDRAPTRSDGKPWFRKACDLGHPDACSKM